MRQPSTDPKLKIQRANQHIADVKARIDIVTSPNSQTIWREMQPQRGIQIIHYRLDKLGDLTDIALVIGDAIHNLKTALDYSWHGLMRRIFGGFPKHFQVSRILFRTCFENDIQQKPQTRRLCPQPFQIDGGADKTLRRREYIPLG